MSAPFSNFQEQLEAERERVATVEAGLSHAYKVRRQQQWNLVYERKKAIFTLEKLRYMGYVRRGTLGSVMQKLGDFGRRLFS